MITNQDLQALEPDRRELAKAGLKALHQSGILSFVITRSTEVLAGGFSTDESAESLAKKIIEQRIANKALFSLNELGRQLNKE